MEMTAPEAREQADEQASYAIWWLSQEASELLDLIIGDLSLPDYIRKEADSRFGRPGRGRLWVARGIDLQEIAWDNTKPLAAGCYQCGGIVIRVEDVHHVACLPGFVTDTELNPFRL